MILMRFREIASCAEHHQDIIVLEDAGEHRTLAIAADPDESRRFTQELSRRVPVLVCAQIVAMSKDLDNLDPRWITRVLSEDPAAGG